MKASVDYEKFFKSKMKKFDVKSPKDFTKAQWEEIDNEWCSKKEKGYEQYFRNKMKEFKVKSPKDLTKSQWNKIDKGWKAKNESTQFSEKTIMNFNEYVESKKS